MKTNDLTNEQLCEKASFAIENDPEAKGLCERVARHVEKLSGIPTTAASVWERISRNGPINEHERTFLLAVFG